MSLKSVQIKKKKLINAVLDQMVEDIRDNYDLTAIEELLKSTPESALIEYLPEEQHKNFK